MLVMMKVIMVTLKVRENPRVKSQQVGCYSLSNLLEWLWGSLRNQRWSGLVETLTDHLAQPAHLTYWKLRPRGVTWLPTDGYKGAVAYNSPFFCCDGTFCFLEASSSCGLSFVSHPLTCVLLSQCWMLLWMDCLRSGGGLRDLCLGIGSKGF